MANRRFNLDSVALESAVRELLQNEAYTQASEGVARQFAIYDCIERFPRIVQTALKG